MVAGLSSTVDLKMVCSFGHFVVHVFSVFSFPVQARLLFIRSAWVQQGELQEEGVWVWELGKLPVRGN